MSKETTDIKIEKLGMEAKPYDKVLAKVAELCPAAVQNGKVDFERLKAELADVVDENVRETYEFKWVGKNAAMVEANKPIRKTLRPCKEESKNWDATENLYIEGDNLEVLKLLEEGYLGKIKMIYIDPPYNTGNDFVYHDNRVQSEEEMNQGIDLFDEEDNRLLSKSFVRNTESSGRFHSDWCSMMYPRLKLARDLLTDDGVIFISIDDNEVANLKKICDEVFGEDNFVADFVWKCRNSLQHDEPLISSQTERITVYTKYKKLWGNDEGPSFNRVRKPFDANEYKNPDNDPRGPWLSSGKTRNDGRPSYTVVSPTGVKFTKPWVPSPAEFKRWEDEGLIWWGKDGNSIPRKKSFLKDFKGNAISDILMDEYTDEIKGEQLKRTKRWEIGTTEAATKFLKELFDGKAYFDYPKPHTLLKYLVQICTGNDSLVLDFFSGSATTAHAVMQLNAEDGGNRKFIMVQLPEETDEKSEAYKADYKNICEIGKERIRRAGDKIVQETGKTDLDIGFRVLKVDDSNMQDVYYKPSELKQADLLSSIDNIKADRTPLDLLFGVMVEWGVSLSLPLQEVKVGENIIHIVGDNDLVACFDKNVSTATITKMAELKPIRVVFRDSCFEKDDEKINMFEIFKTICHWDDKQVKDNVRVM